MIQTNSVNNKSTQPYCVAVGAANIDVYGFSFESIVLHQSNPGKIKIKAGGGVRNVVENLLRLGAQAYLITAIGRDHFGDILVKDCERKGIDVSHSLFLDEDTSIYMAMMDDNRDMKVGLSDLTIEDYILPEFLETKHELLEGASVIQIGSGLPIETITYLIDRYQHKELFMDTSSIGKIKHMYSQMYRNLTLKMNRIEAQYLSNRVFNTPQSFIDNSQLMIDKGARRIYITLGQEGSFYYDGITHVHIKAPKVNIKSTSGAGDAFMAGMIYGVLGQYPPELATSFATACSSFCLTSENTVSEDMNFEAVDAFRKEHFSD
jgi:pseudouridine kinase